MSFHKSDSAAFGVLAENVSEMRRDPLSLNNDLQASRRIVVRIDNEIRRESLVKFLAHSLCELTVEGHEEAVKSADVRNGIVIGCPLLKQNCTLEIQDYIREIESDYPNLKVVVLSDNPSLELANAALSRGISGYILPSTSAEIFLSAVRLILAGGLYFPAELVRSRGSASHIETEEYNSISKDENLIHPGKSSNSTPPSLGLTGRELDVVELLQKGRPNKLIAYDLKMSESTVKVHMRNIMRKLGATNRTQVLIFTREFNSSSPASHNDYLPNFSVARCV